MLTMVPLRISPMYKRVILQVRKYERMWVFVGEENELSYSLIYTKKSDEMLVRGVNLHWMEVAEK